MEMKTTTVRKLLPETWGFLCPVHTPDGSPCGLLNHLASKCVVVTEDPPEDLRPRIAKFMAGLGMLAIAGRYFCVHLCSLPHPLSTHPCEQWEIDKNDMMHNND